MISKSGEVIFFDLGKMGVYICDMFKYNVGKNLICFILIFYFKFYYYVNKDILLYM